MANKKNISQLPECFPCWAKYMDTFIGTLKESREVYLAKPMEYLNKTIAELNAKHKAENKPAYLVHIERDPKDNRVFRFCSIRYGRREITYTNTAKLETRLGERKLTCIKLSTQTAIQQFTTDMTAEQYAATKQQEWHKAGYKGTFTVNGSGTNKSCYGNFTMEKDHKELTITCIPTSGKLHVKRILTRETQETIHADIRPETWRQKIHREMLKDGFKGSLDTRKNAYGKVIVVGKYTKSAKIDNGSMICEVEFYNSNIRPDGLKREKGYIDENFRPQKKSGKSLIQVRSIAQDDNYTPEWKGKQIPWDKILLNKDYAELLSWGESETEMTRKALENFEQRAMTAPDKKAIKWLRQINKTKPNWIKAANARTLVDYCIKRIKLDNWTPLQCTNYCKKWAYYA